MNVIVSLADLFLFAIAVIAGVCVYLLPSIVAAYRDHPHWLTIAVVNVLMGWTGIGWIVAFVWSCVTPESWQRAKASVQKLRHLTGSAE